MKDGAKLRMSYSEVLKKDGVGLRQADREPCSILLFSDSRVIDLLLSGSRVSTINEPAAWRRMRPD